MNIIVEVMKKNTKSLELVYVVRYGNGQPIAVFNNLDDVKSCIEEQVNVALKPVTDKSA